MALSEIGKRNVVAPLVSIWNRLPVIVRAPITGLLLAAAGTVPWAILVSENLKHAPTLPWAVFPAGLYLSLFWRFVRGVGWPQSSAAARRTLCRANFLSAEVWGMALVAGVFGLAAVVLLQQLMARLIMLPQQQKVDTSQLPFVTVLLWVVMGSLVAGVVEEATFRGYMQGPIERAYGPVIAILVTGSLFGFAHFTHPEVGLVLLPYYLVVSAVYGALAYFTKSILPSMLLHAVGDMFSALDLLASGRSQWQGSSRPILLIWETGPDASFWFAVIAFLVVATVAVGMYATLANVVAKTQ